MVSTKRGLLCMLIMQPFCGTYLKATLPLPQLYKDLQVPQSITEGYKFRLSGLSGTGS